MRYLSLIGPVNMEFVSLWTAEPITSSLLLEPTRQEERCEVSSPGQQSLILIGDCELRAIVPQLFPEDMYDEEGLEL